MAKNLIVHFFINTSYDKMNFLFKKFEQKTPGLNWLVYKEYFIFGLITETVIGKQWFILEQHLEKNVILANFFGLQLAP